MVFPQYAVSKWIGHSILVSGKHYANDVPDELFQRASAEPKRVVQKTAQIQAESTEMDGKQKQKNPDLPGYSATLLIVPIGATRLAPSSTTLS